MKPKLDDDWYPEGFDWYVKWAATICILTSIIARAGGVEYRSIDLGVGTIGVLLWLWVSIMWKDRALIMLNAVSAAMLATAFLREF